MAMGQQKDRQHGELRRCSLVMYFTTACSWTDRGRLRRLRRGGLPALLRGQDGGAFGATRALFRMHLVGYSRVSIERGLEWRLGFPGYVLLEMRERVPDHSWRRTRARLPHEVHTAVFDWVLALIAEAGLVKGERIGVDASTIESNAALHCGGTPGLLDAWPRRAVSRHPRHGASGPQAQGQEALARTRSDPEAKIAKMKDGTTHLAYKPEHAVDPPELHPADTTTLPKTLAAADRGGGCGADGRRSGRMVTDKGYHSRLVLKALDDGPWKSRISEPKQKGFARWHGDDAARRAVTNIPDPAVIGGGQGSLQAARRDRRALVCPQPRSRRYAPDLASGPRERAQAIPASVAGHNLSLLMRQLIGAGTPKEAVAGGIGALFVLVTPAGAVLVVQIVLIVSEDGETASPRYASPWRETRSMTPFSTGC